MTKTQELPVGRPLSSPENTISIFFHLILFCFVFHSLHFCHPYCHFQPLWKSLRVCLVPGSCWLCVLSLSLMSAHSLHWPYLKWPEPHQQINIQAPPAHPAPSFWVVFNHSLSGAERQPPTTHKATFFCAQWCHYICRYNKLGMNSRTEFLRKSFPKKFPQQPQSHC